MKVLFANHIIKLMVVSLTIFSSSVRAETSDLLESIKTFDVSTLPENVTFNRHIRPILSDNCFACHGNDKGNRKADLTFSSRENAITPRKSGITPIVPGNAMASEMIKRISHANIADRMPPKLTDKTLSAREISLLKRWIDQGAEYEKHWAYNVPNKSTVPETSEGWAKNPIDNFVVRKHQELTLSATEQADKRTLIRRVTLDLIGLPPTLGEVNDFINDTSTNAYEKVVDRLLASKHYGERMAIDWLDVVRYADTWGYHSDNERNVWPYRDYVIDSFNNNTPFSTFTKEQLAGDLMPETGHRGLTASTYNMLIKITQEGGAQNKEYLVKSMVDRISNVGTTWLGSTTGCAVCHDHKFDPYSAKDTYSLGAFFADIDGKGYWGGSRIGSKIYDKFPIAFVGKDADRKQLTTFQKLLKKWLAKRTYKDVKPAEKKAATAATKKTKPQKIVAKQNSEESSVFESLDKVSIEKGLPNFNVWLNQTAALSTEPSVWHQMNIDALKTQHNQATLEDNSVIRTTWQNPEKPNSFVITGNGNFPSKITALQLDMLDAKQDPRAKGTNSRFAMKDVKVTVQHQDGSSDSTLIDFHSFAYNPTPPEFNNYSIAKYHLEDDYRYNPDLGNRTTLQGQDIVIHLRQALTWQAGDTLEIELDLAWFSGVPGVGATALPSTRINVTGVTDLGPNPDAAITLANKPKNQRSDVENSYLRKYYNLYSTVALEIERSISQTEIGLVLLSKTLPNTWITKTKETPSTTRILPRGDWMDETGEIVEPAIPEFLGKLDIKDRRANRLDLANWLISKENPLTARVTINRFWKKFYGTGLSKVLDDLGSQGEWPTHPDLLDWLAVEFIESGWNVKHMVRLMVTSATYQQSSIVNETKRQLDPYNRYYARQAQVRLPAEVVRDNALAIAGLLNKKIGGASVRPYQPEGFLSDLEFPKRAWRTEQNKNQYRRGMYTFWQRSRLHPMLQSFDAPARNEGHANRVVSNTPLQALILLNDPSFVEAARAMAVNMMLHTGGVDTKINWALEKTLARPSASSEELTLLTQAYSSNLTYFTEHQDEVDPLLSKGLQPPPLNLNKIELAAWTSVARIILNLHETVTRF